MWIRRIFQSHVRCLARRAPARGRACDGCSCCYGIISSGDNSVHSHWPIPLSPRDSGASPPIQRVAVSRPYTTSLSPPPLTSATDVVDKFYPQWRSALWACPVFETKPRRGTTRREGKTVAPVPPPSEPPPPPFRVNRHRISWMSPICSGLLPLVVCFFTILCETEPTRGTARR